MSQYVGHLMIDGELIPVHLERVKASQAPSAWLTATQAGAYIGADRQRIADLTYQGKLKPDGYDGRSPRFRPETLDAYLRR